MSQEACEYLTQRYYEDIPLTRFLGLRVTEFDGNNIELRAPFEPSRNTHGTAFGGSLYSIAALTGWGLLHLRLEDDAIASNAVIVSGEVKYLLPVETEIVTRSTLDLVAYQRFVLQYKRRKRAKIALKVEVMLEDEVAMSFTGQYAITDPEAEDD